MNRRCFRRPRRKCLNVLNIVKKPLKTENFGLARIPEPAHTVDTVNFYNEPREEEKGEFQSERLTERQKNVNF